MKPWLVAVSEAAEARYPPPPFHPDRRYPEVALGGISPEPNGVYAAVRECFLQLGLDRERAGGAAWNPLEGIIRPGMRVLVKPNLVRHYHPYGLDPAALVAHGSVIRAVCDYVLLAGGARTQLVIADAPLQSCVFDDVLRLAGVDRLAEYYRSQGVRVEVRDLRLVRAVMNRRFPFGRILMQAPNAGDPAGYTVIDLGDRSLHAGRGCGSFRVTCYDPGRMEEFHGEGRHQYVIANSLLEADVVINLPKMKTHHKAGITGALKNFIGINGHKDCLPHHTKGTPEEGGDEYLRADRVKRLDSWLLDRKEKAGGVAALKTAAVAHRLLHRIHMGGEDSYWEGSWWGNQTISRTTLDLNRIVGYADREGRLRSRRQRTVFTVVDGVIAGERDGPLAPDPKPAGVVLAGFNPVAVDMVMARLMGFAWRSIPTLRQAFERGEDCLAECLPEQVQIASESPVWKTISCMDAGPSLGFVPHAGWKGRIEL